MEPLVDKKTAIFNRLREKMPDSLLLDADKSTFEKTPGTYAYKHSSGDYDVTNVETFFLVVLERVDP